MSLSSLAESHAAEPNSARSVTLKRFISTGICPANNCKVCARFMVHPKRLRRCIVLPKPDEGCLDVAGWDVGASRLMWRLNWRPGTLNSGFQMVKKSAANAARQVPALGRRQAVTVSAASCMTPASTP